MTDTNISRHELKIKHRRIVERAQQIGAKYEDMRKMLQEFNDSYIQLYEYFPVRRYPKMKKLVKRTISKENIEKLRQAVEESRNVESDDPERDSEEEESDTEGRPLVSGGKPYGMAKQALRKITKFCGLDNDPIEDEDVMSDEDLWKHISRRKRQIHFYHKRMTKTLSALETLKNKYVSSKTSYFPIRFFILKRMVREVIAETEPDSKYEK